MISRGVSMSPESFGASVPVSRKCAWRQRRGGSARRPNGIEERASTPVLMVAMDGGLPESRPGPDGSTEARERDGADVYRSQARSQVFRENPGSRRDAEPHRGSEGVLRPIPAGAGARRAAGPTRACRPCSSRCSRSRIFPTPRCSNSSSTNSKRRNTTSTSAASAA